MKYSAIRVVLFIAALAFGTGCAMRGMVPAKVDVRGCVELFGERPTAPDCIHVELHRFLPGRLHASGSYVLEERQKLGQSRCFTFSADVGERIAIKTRDSDRVLIGGRANVVVERGGNVVSIVHRRSLPAIENVPQGKTATSCDSPLSSSE